MVRGRDDDTGRRAAPRHPQLSSYRESRPYSAWAIVARRALSPSNPFPDGLAVGEPLKRLWGLTARRGRSE